MKILILAATAFELNSIKEKIKSEKFIWFNFSFFCTWIWNFEAILNLTKFLENIKNWENFDFILNFWICWYKNLEWENKKFENFLQVWRIFWWAKWKEFLIPQFINFWEIWSIFSSEKIILNWKEILDENFVEMEGFWIEYVLEKKWIPRIYFKFPFDKIWWEKTWENKTINFKQKLPEIKNILQKNLDYEKLFKKIEKFLEKNNQKNFGKELNFIEKNIWKLTFQDKNIFEKLFFKYETLSWNKIFDLIKKFWEWEKKNLLEKINSETEKFLI